MKGRGGIRQGILFSRAFLEGALLFYPFEFSKKKGSKKMKKTLTVTLSLILILMLCLASCNKVDAEGLWGNATYRKDMTFGKGETTVELEVKVADQSITFTVNTDKKTLGEALLEHDLIAGDEGAYGLYVKQVNGIVADYDIDGSYWALYKNGEMCMNGVDTTNISDGEHYEFVYTK